MMSLSVLRSEIFVFALLLAPVSAADPGGENVQGSGGVVRTLMDVVEVGGFVDGPDEDAPLPPTGLRATVDGPDVVLTWDAPIAGSPASYRIYRMDLPNAGSVGIPPGGSPSIHVVWPPLQQVPSDDTSYRDTTVNLTTHQYVYAVTATYNGFGAAPGAQSEDTQESPPSDPAYTWNTWGHCPWLRRLPDFPYYDLRPECIVPHPLDDAWMRLLRGLARVESGVV